MTKPSILLFFFGDATRDRRVQNFSRYFQSQGWNVELLAIESSIPSGPRKFLDYHRTLQRAVREKRADVVMACDLYSLSATAWMKRHGRASVVLYDAREVYTELPAVAHAPLKKKIWQMIERRGLLQSNLIIVTAPKDAQAICDVHRFLPRPVLIRNLPWKESQIIPDREFLRRLNIPNGAKTAVYLGGLQPGRALERLIEAMERSTHHLLLIGDGILRSTLESEIRKSALASRVHCVGSISSDEALRIVAACDVGISLVEPVSESYRLALPSKHFEYMMCGIPIVSSGLKHVMELFPNEEWIAYVDESSSQAIAEGIDMALKKSQIPELRKQERALALENYHFEHDAKNLIEAIHSFLK